MDLNMLISLAQPLDEDHPQRADSLGDQMDLNMLISLAQPLDEDHPQRADSLGDQMDRNMRTKAYFYHIHTFSC